MKTIGLVGGMSWESSAVYYEQLNSGVEERVGPLSSARLVMASVDFAEVTRLQEAEDWDAVAALLVEAAQGVERAGADVLLLCTTTFHQVADQVEAAIGIPLLHLADVVAQAAKDAGLSEVGLLGTTFAMERDFFVDRLASHGLKVHVPDPDHHDTVNRIIYDELVHGRVVTRSRRTVTGLIDDLWDAGAGGVILGCTELELLISQADAQIPVLGCTSLHVGAALDHALA
ncbi:aspartate/glutamate racemase family protein [Nocardioides bruguierae]|uniref:Amino acid racemase n=1 Tax=Nocardioides bruguierae TaxID=2945102 RepID=A0A9X2D9U3_9ACTN|nr:amino acid racemase [Nocardioides bruguierae]MCM0621796.1 amino acid racemase [Nocardioides bruguierae]